MMGDSYGALRYRLSVGMMSDSYGALRYRLSVGMMVYSQCFHSIISKGYRFSGGFDGVFCRCLSELGKIWGVAESRYENKNLII